MIWQSKAQCAFQHIKWPLKTNPKYLFNDSIEPEKLKETRLHRLDWELNNILMHDHVKKEQKMNSF